MGGLLIFQWPISKALSEDYLGNLGKLILNLRAMDIHTDTYIYIYRHVAAMGLDQKMLLGKLNW